MTNQFKTSTSSSSLSPPPPPQPPLPTYTSPLQLISRQKFLYHKKNPEYFNYYLHMGEINDCRQKLSPGSLFA